MFRYRVKHKQREPDLEILQNKQLYTKIIFLVSLIALWIFRWLNAVSFFLVFQGFRAHFRFVDPTAMPLCSISLLYCVFPICGITHLLKKVKKRQVRIKTRPGWPKMKPPYLRYHFFPGNCLPFTRYPLLLLLYHPIFLNFPLLPLPPPPHFLPKYFHHLSHGYPTSVFVTRYLQLPFPFQVFIPLTS